MNEFKKIAYKNQANTIIKKLQLRHMAGYYVDNMEEATKKVLELLGSVKKTVAYGGSMTIDDSDLKERIATAGHELIIRENAKTEAELKEVKAKTVNADAFLMSSNAITLDGELINIDGRGNRVSYMIYGPDKVIMVVGMNKVVPTVEDGIRRVRNVASPANTARLHVDSPCAKTGRCANCLDNTICDQIVVTRASRVPERIQVILVGEELGY